MFCVLYNFYEVGFFPHRLFCLSLEPPEWLVSSREITLRREKVTKKLNTLCASNAEFYFAI